jgi:hypothetical protein
MTVMDKEGDTIALGDAIGLLHDGMEKVAFDVVKFQTMVGDLVRMAGSTADQDVIERAQAIDALAQTLFRLTRSAEAIGKAARCNGSACAALPLGAQQIIALQHAVRTGQASDGDVDLF